MRVIISNKACLGILSPRPAHTVTNVRHTHKQRDTHLHLLTLSHPRTEILYASLFIMRFNNRILISFLISGQLVFNSPRWEQVGLPQRGLYWVTGSALRLCGRLTSLWVHIFIWARLWPQGGEGKKNTERGMGQVWKSIILLHHLTRRQMGMEICKKQMTSRSLTTVA